MASADSLEDLMQEEMKDIYDAEHQLTKALPKMIKKATTGELKQAFEEHLQQTEQHIERLEEAFELLGLAAKKKRCEGMKHLITQGESMIADAEEEATRDAVIIASAQKVEHYEIASYGTLRTWANLLGKNDVAALLEETLEEEKEADQKLTGIAESSVNIAAAEEGEEGEEEMPAGRGARTPTTRSARQLAADRGGRGTKKSRGASKTSR